MGRPRLCRAGQDGAPRRNEIMGIPGWCRGSSRFLISSALAVLTVGCLFSRPAQADDWPQWLGPRRDGVWRETGILERFPAGGPVVLWRTPIGAGYAGPAVADGRV